MLDELFEAGEDRFLDEVLQSRSEKKLKSFAEKWYRDGRPFARKALLRYIDDGCERPHHRPLVKAFFKLAEAAQDDEAMGHFLAAFDRLSRRDLVKRTGFDWAARQPTETFELRPDLKIPLRARRQKGRDGKPRRSPEGHQLYEPLETFTRVTRQYLQRRAFRYFRKLAKKDPARYGKSIRAALALYQDEHLSKPERLIDAWSLMHGLYHGSKVLSRKPRGITVAEGHTLAELSPAPYAPQAWKGCPDALFELCLAAKSRTVRSFAISLLKRDEPSSLRGVPIERVRACLRSPHPEVQTFGAELLKGVSGLERLPLHEWLALLEIENPQALPLICELVEKSVAPDRLSLEQCIALACARTAPVAELGLKWARGKQLRTEHLREMVKLGAAAAPKVRAEAVDWVCQLLLMNDEARPELVRELLDSRFPDVRARALGLMDKDTRFGESTLLWTAMAESPHDDVRQRLVASLSAREHAYEPGSLRQVWVSSLLSVHRGGKVKRAVAQQVASRIARKPEEAEKLLPLLGHALRSIRPPDRRSALACLSSAAFHRPELRAAIGKALPELRFVSEQVTA
ncbi:MAG: hypothetical protein HYZ28_24310 [Myxococcales bacterium]|nr:hypothetical protein [Myxococcales bacterium]